MNLIDYGRIILQRGWILLLLGILGAVGAFLFSQTMTPIYRSTVTVLVTPSRTDFGLTQAAVQLLNSRVAYLQSNDRAQAIIDSLNLDMEPAFLRSRTRFEAVRDNLTIKIEVDMEDPSTANRIATEWGTTLIRYNNMLNQEASQQDRIRTELQDSAQAGLFSPNKTINTFIGAFMGIFIGGIIIFVLEFLESSIIHRVEDIENGVDMKVLAIVPADH